MTRPSLPLVLLLLLFCSSFARAADGFAGSLGRLYLSFDPTEQLAERDLHLFRPFSFYLIAEVDFVDIEREDLNALSGIASWEAGVRVPPQLTILSRTVPASCCGSDCLDKLDHTDNWIVELCSASAGLKQPVVLVEYLAMLSSLDVAGLQIGIAPSAPSRLGGQGMDAAPGWLELEASGDCASEPCFRPFEDWFGNDLRLNPVAVGVSELSFSRLKGRY